MSKQSNRVTAWHAGTLDFTVTFYICLLTHFLFSSFTH